MIDVNILLMSSFISLLILIIVGFFLYYKFPEEKYFKYFAFFPTFFLTGELLRTFRITIADFFSVVFANTLMATGVMFLYIGVRALLKLESQWHNRYYIPISIVFLGFMLFTYIHYDVAMRILIFSVFTIIYTFSISWIFFKNARKKFKKLDYFSAFLFLLGIVIFLIRTLKASMIEISENQPKATELFNTLIYSYLFFMTVWFSIILIIKANDLKSDKKSLELEEEKR